MQGGKSKTTGYTISLQATVHPGALATGTQQKTYICQVLHGFTFYVCITISSPNGDDATS
jgi:hypothetical protein